MSFETDSPSYTDGMVEYTSGGFSGDKDPFYVSGFTEPNRNSTSATFAFDDDGEKFWELNGVSPFYVSGFTEPNRNSTSATVRSLGTTAFGITSSPEGASVNGVLEVLNDGERRSAMSLSGGFYKSVSPPTEVLGGESNQVADYNLRVLLESGGVSNNHLDAYRYNNVPLAFGSIEISISDVEGEPIQNRLVSAGEAVFATEPDGKVSFLSSGEQTLTALGGKASETVTVQEGGSVSSSFQYAGVEGKVASPVAGPINGVQVVLVDEDGEPVDVTETNRNGTYKFKTANPDTDYKVRAGPFERDAPTEGQGDYTLRNMPQNDDVATLEIQMTDQKSSDPAVDVNIISEQFSSKSDPEGVGKVIDFDDEVTAIVAQDDPRYENAVITEDVGRGELTEVDIQLERKSSIGGAT